LGGSLPASARLPIHSKRSACDTVQVRSEESFQVRPSASVKVGQSAMPPSLYFCRRTPLPRAISGTWFSGKTSSLRFSPTIAT
jgi:hypothetical protein